MPAHTILLIHGAWLNPTSWDPWCERYRAAGYACEAPAWPGDEGSPAALRAQPSPDLADLDVPAIVDHYAALIEAMPEPPILIGHSFGGLIVQMLLDRGLGAVGVAIDSAPPRGILPTASALKASLPVLRHPASHVGTISFEDFAWGFVHQLPEADQRAAYDRYVVPTPGRVFYDVAFAPLSHKTKVDWRNDDRAPLLLLAGGHDRTVTAAMNRANFRHYLRSSALTDFHEFPDRSHWTIAEPGWEEVADYALSWAQWAETARK